MTKRSYEDIDRDWHITRRQALDDACQQKGWRFNTDVTMRILDGSSLYHIAEHNRHYDGYIFGEDWEYAEIGFVVKDKLIHYGVMSVQLPRKLPNVVFDSLKHQRKQFKLVFDPKQKIQLEGNFDSYFVTYFGTEYTIDDLSFITPEVMEALIDGDDYDIEIVHDRLLLFGQIEPDPAEQITKMSSAISRIRKKLLNNILTYRDERVPYEKGRKIVARAGMFLSVRQISVVWLSIAVALIYITFIVLSILVEG